MNIPIELFALFIGSSIGFAVFGFIRNPQIPALLAFAGIFILFISVTTDTIQFGYSEIIEEPEYSVSYPMQVNTGITGIVFSSTTTAVSERPANDNSALLDKKISCISISMSKTGSPVGDMNVGIMDANSIMTKTFVTIDTASSVISSSQKDHTFCLPNHDYYVIGVKDYIGVMYTTGTAGNTINMYTFNVDTFDGTNSVRASFNSGSWVEVSGTDIRMTLINEELQIDKTSEPNLVQFTEIPKVMFALLGAIFMLSGGLMVAKNN